MAENLRRPGTSPLISPPACAAILLAPQQQDLARMSRQGRVHVRNSFLRILSAANIAGIPPFVYSRCKHPQKHAFAVQAARLPHREFCSSVHAFPWQYAPFREALDELDRSILVVAGFWFEHQLVATVLHALADSYDVYFVLDASPAKMRAAVQLSQDRLIQAGATPVVVSQVIHEWSLEVVNVEKRAALNSLLLKSANAD